ncbi:hypothetical protein [Sporosarcina ureilytica]|uniref:hypothetical protein n=1 Tax=Sporosarcina ureilytica TaxID=298596 RepID=UPI00143A8573|nr:hypothetical protein [Sporosarcina ureilytica]
MNIIKRFALVSMVLAVFLITACSGKKVEHFPSKKEALDSFIEKEEVKGNIDLILTTKGESLLAIQSREDVFFVGELIEDKDGNYYARRISDNVGVGIGASWELNTKNKNKYTIYFENDKKDSNYLPFSNGEYSIALSEGHTITENTLEFTNTINVVELIKD